VFVFFDIEESELTCVIFGAFMPLYLLIVIILESVYLMALFDATVKIW